jgi:hypothetical protein
MTLTLPLRVRRREIAVMVGILTALHTWVTWGSLQPRPVVSDEISYLLQARIFASGHWVAPSPPSEPAFQQLHVIVSPVLASKYPPGHSLLLAVGALVNAPWLVPVVLAGVSGGVLYLLLAECGSTFAALCGWAYWLGDPLALRFRPAYYSENTSGLTWLLAWWLLVQWRKSSKRHYLVWLSIVVGWCAITRPLTAVALALPLAIWLVNPLARARAWKDAVWAGVAGVCILAILGVANYATTGNPFKTTFSLYADQYLPVDRLGFRIDSTPPRFRLAPPAATSYEEIRSVHVGHIPRRLPTVAATILRELAVAEWGGWRVVMIPLVAIGLWQLSFVAWLAIANAVVLFLLYLCWAHYSHWTIYYFEGLPIFAFTIANGLRVLGEHVRRTRLTVATASAAAALYVAGIVETTASWRAAHVAIARPMDTFEDELRQVPFARSVVFVRYDTSQHGQPALAINSPTLQEDARWIVNSWGPTEDLKLLGASGERVPLLFDVKTLTLGTYRELLDSLRLRRRATDSSR